MKYKYYVHYVDNSTPKLKKFKTQKAAIAFVSQFRSKYPVQMIDQGYWIDFILKGEILESDDYYKGDV